MSTSARFDLTVKPQPSTDSSAVGFPDTPGSLGAVWSGELQSGETRPVLDIDSETRRYVLATQTTTYPDLSVDGEAGPMPLSEWDPRTAFSESAAVDPASALDGLTVSTGRIDPAVTTYPSATAGDPWAFVVGDEEADLGVWPGRYEQP